MDYTQNTPATEEEKATEVHAKDLSLAATLFVITSIPFIVPSVLIVIMGTDWSRLDFGIAAAICAPGVYLLVIATLLYRKKRIGRILAWTVLPLLLLAFPIGTVLSAIIIWKMEAAKSLLR